MSDNIIQLSQELIHKEFNDLVCNSVEEIARNIVTANTAGTFKPRLVRSN